MVNVNVGMEQESSLIIYYYCLLFRDYLSFRDGKGGHRPIIKESMYNDSFQELEILETRQMHLNQNRYMGTIRDYKLSFETNRFC